MYNETVQRLEKFSDPSEFERLGCDLLSRLGYRGIEPQGVGRKDGGKDALHLTEDHKTVIHFSLRRDWDKKLLEDLETTEKSEGKFTKFIFVSNRRIPPIRRDKFKELIRSKYGWEPVIIDQEFLRVELDSHSLDLRKKYLGISEDYKNQIVEIMNDFVEKRDEYSNYLSKSRFVRILLLSIPNLIHDNKMKLYDEKRKFVGDIEKLKSILGEILPVEDFDSKITSDSFSTYHIKKYRGFLDTLGSESIYESNLYHNGIIEILLDAKFVTIDEGLINNIIDNFFAIMERLYDGFVGKDEYVTLAVWFINAIEMNFKKNDGIIYRGEEYYLYHETEEKLDTLLTDAFQEEFSEILRNKIDNFFNIKL